METNIIYTKFYFYYYKSHTEKIIINLNNFFNKKKIDFKYINNIYNYRF
jgi:hypothetical protein